MGQRAILKVVFFDGGQNIKNRGVFAAARQEVGPFSFYLFLHFLLFGYYFMMRQNADQNCRVDNSESECQSYKFEPIIDNISLILSSQQGSISISADLGRISL